MAIPYLLIVFAIGILIAACAPLSTSTPPSPAMMSPTAASRVSTPPPIPSLTPHQTYAATIMPASQSVTTETQIRVIIGDAILTGRLWDNTPARDLIAQLPLTLTFSDFNAQEKLAILPRKLSLEGVPEGDGANPRDIGYYAPSGHLVFYYAKVGYFNGIVRIGQFDGDMNFIMKQTRDFSARIELIQ